MKIGHVARSSSEIGHVIEDWSNPEHIAASKIGLVAHLSMGDRSSRAPHQRSLVTASALAFRPPYSDTSLRYFILITSLFFSLWLSLSLSLSLSLKSLKWNEWDSLSLYSLRLTLSDSFELWLAEALTLLIFCLFFFFFFFFFFIFYL